MGKDGFFHDYFLLDYTRQPGHIFPGFIFYIFFSFCFYGGFGVEVLGLEFSVDGGFWPVVQGHLGFFRVDALYINNKNNPWKRNFAAACYNSQRFLWEVCKQNVVVLNSNHSITQ